VDLKQNTARRVRVILMDVNGNGLPGIAYSQVTASLQKYASAAAAFAVTSLNWFEIDSSRLAGHYDIGLATGDCDTLLDMWMRIDAPGSIGATLSLNVVPQDPADVKTVLDLIKGILGLYRLVDQIVRDGNGNVTSSRIRWYDTQANKDAASASSPSGGTTGILGTLTYSATNDLHGITKEGIG